MSDDFIRIAHINLARGYRGGERQTQLLIEGLAKRGWPQRLICRRDQLLARRCRSVSGLTITEVAANAFAGASALRACDIVHVHEGRAIQSAWLNSLLRSTPYVVTRRVQKGPRHTRVNRAMYRRAELVVPVSAAIGASIDALADNIDWRVVPDASSGLSADPARVDELRAEFGGDFIVGHIGALDDSHKGQLQIIAVAKRVAGAMPGLRFVLVGSGRDESMLKRAANGMENVLFTGQVDDVGNYLAAFDAFIYPSRHEGLGSILLDAFEFGLPIVATQVGGIPELVDDGTNGLLVAPDDIPVLEQAIDRLYHDAGLREAIGRANENKAEDFSPERMTSRYVDIYTAIAAAHERRKVKT
jgi:glycosyltransferase involved in cell wall biosynthesis